MDSQREGSVDAAEIPEREKLINKEYKRRELQNFARAAGIKANVKNDELYDELMEWLDKQEKKDSSIKRDQAPDLTPIMPQEAPRGQEQANNSLLRFSISGEEHVGTPVIHVPPKNDEPDVPYIQFAGKVANMVSPSLPQSRFQDHLKEAGLPVPMVSEQLPTQSQALNNSADQSLDEKPGNDSLFHVLDISSASIYHTHAEEDNSALSQVYDVSIANNKTTESLCKPNFNFSGMQTETMSWQTTMGTTSTLSVEKDKKLTRERQYESLRRVVVEEFNNVRKRMKRHFDEHMHKFTRLAQVSLISVPPHLRAVALQAILDGEQAQPKVAASDSLIETLSKLKQAAAR